MVVNKWYKCSMCIYYRPTIQKCGRHQYLCPIPKGRINSKKYRYKTIWQ